MSDDDHDDETYDDRQLAAALVTWLCCHRTVYATHPEHGCGHCRSTTTQRETITCHTTTTSNLPARS